MIRARATRAVFQAQQRYKTSFDKSIERIPVFEEGSLVYLEINSSVTSKRPMIRRKNYNQKNWSHTELLPYNRRPSLWKNTEFSTPSAMTEYQSPNIKTQARYRFKYPSSATKYQFQKTTICLQQTNTKQEKRTKENT